MALGILDCAANLPGSGRVTNPLAGVAHFVALGWGPGSNGPVSTVLSCAGATIDTSFAQDGVESNLDLSGLSGFNLGWHPDGKPVYLSPREAAYGLWRITFPAVTTYTLSLSGIGTAQLTSAAAPAAPVLPTFKLLDYRPLGDLASQLFEVSFTGTYPAGGFGPITGDRLGVATPFFAHIQDTAAYRFSWNRTDEKLHVYNSSGEVSGAISFTTQGIWHGSAT